MKDTKEMIFLTLTIRFVKESERMKQFIDKLIGRLEDGIFSMDERMKYDIKTQKHLISQNQGIRYAINSINELAEEYINTSTETSSGWIPCSERLPNSEKEIPTLVNNAEYWLKVYFKLKDIEDLEEQGLLLRLPCKVGGTVYCIYERYTKCSENEQEFDEYSCQGCECLECDSHKEFYVQSQKAYSLDWIVSNLKRFGKTVFLTQAEAEQKLKEMESD